MYFTPKNESKINGKRTKSDEKLPFADNEKFANQFYIQIVEEDYCKQRSIEFGDARQSFHEYLVSGTKYGISDD